MTPERWKRVDELYHAAVGRAPADRSAFLDEACAGDPTVRREVESLLNEPASDPGFLEQPAVVLTGDLASSMNTLAMPGRILGGYHLEALLGAGGMGEVYRARDAKLGRDVAIKLLPPVFTRDHDRLARFEREARMLAALNHPNICAIYGFQEADGLPFLILELVEGETLADVLREKSGGSGLPLSRALTVARQIVDALEMAHERGIIHRDLKPANIKVTPGGVVKVLDFGLAKIVRSDPSTPGLTAAPAAGRGGVGPGAMIGTAAYMSPEQARGLEVDKRTDLWAFGCVLYEMLTGRLAFAGDTLSDSIAKILEREPDWSVLPVTTPPSIRRLLLRCLTKDPNRRLRDIGDARIEIDAVDEALPVSLPPRFGLAGARRLLPWIAVFGLALAIGVWLVPDPVPALEHPLANATFSQLTDWEGTEAGAEISPDGRFVVFASDQAGEFDLWVRQIGTNRFRNLTGDIPALRAPGIILRSFGFTGDGSEIWFSASGDPQEAKMLIPLDGGTPRPFLTAGKATPVWSPDDTRMIFEEIKVGSGDPLFLADRTGANARAIFVHPDHTQHNHNPVWSPDGEWIYFVQGSDPSADMDIWRIRPSGESLERMTRQNIAVNFLAVLDARTVVYVARDKDRSGPWLWALDVVRKDIRRLVSGLDQFTSIAASRDGQRLVATVANSVAGMWRVPLLNRIADEADAAPYPMPTARALAPRFSGPSLFYLSARGAGDGLWRLQDGVASEVRLGADAALSEPPAVSPDGARVAVIIRQDGKRLLAMMSADGTDSHILAAAIDIQGAAGQGAADWSPDGKWIVFGGRDTRGPGLFKIAVDDGSLVRLRDGEFVNPVWSPTDELIVYAGPFAAGQVTLYGSTPDGTPVRFPDLRVRPGGYRFSPDGKALVYLPTITSLDFWRLDLVTKARRQLSRLSDRGELHTFDISPDGKYIVFDRSREKSDIVLIERQK